jgi:hypothetical protein
MKILGSSALAGALHMERARGASAEGCIQGLAITADERDGRIARAQALRTDTYHVLRQWSCIKAAHAVGASKSFAEVKNVNFRHREYGAEFPADRDAERAE